MCILQRSAEQRLNGATLLLAHERLKSDDKRYGNREEADNENGKGNEPLSDQVRAVLGKECDCLSRHFIHQEWKGECQDDEREENAPIPELITELAPGH